MGRSADPSEERLPSGDRKPLNADLSGLTIGTLSLTPSFDPDVTEYTATTSNDTNKVTATPADETATVKILVGETEIENASSATWQVGENTVTITITDGTVSKVYTVTVTKE